MVGFATVVPPTGPAWAAIEPSRRKQPAALMHQGCGLFSSRRFDRCPSWTRRWNNGRETNQTTTRFFRSGSRSHQRKHQGRRRSIRSSDAQPPARTAGGYAFLGRGELAGLPSSGERRCTATARYHTHRPVSMVPGSCSTTSFSRGWKPGKLTTPEERVPTSGPRWWLRIA